METTIVPDAYLAHRHLDEQFERELGRNHRGEIPAHLLEQLARYFDVHANDMMVTYYARKLLDKQARAFAIALSVWGGYRNNLLSRLRRHFSQQDNFCEYRYPGLMD